MQVTGCVKEGHLLEICGWYRNMISLGVLLHFNTYPTCGTLETKTQQRNTHCLEFNHSSRYDVFIDNLPCLKPIRKMSVMVLVLCRNKVKHSIYKSVWSNGRD